jgi:hypothetical protein
VLGQEHVLPMKYDPRERRYLVEHEHMSPELGSRVIADSRTLMRALGYDMCSMEWAVKDGVPYAIDFMNPAPDMDLNSLTPHYFDWVVKGMADLAIRLAKEPRPQRADLRWDGLLTGRRQDLLSPAPTSGAPRLTGQADLDGAGDLAEELPSLATGLPRGMVSDIGATAATERPPRAEASR